MSDGAGPALLLTGIAQLLTMPPDAASDANPEEALGLVTDGAILIDEAGRVAWVGPRSEAPAAPRTDDLGGRLVLPGLVDPHTHVVYAGDRAADWEARCRGVSYTEIAARGGGIRLTVRATRAADVDALAALARPRLARLLARGVTTVEVKSGYGLSLEAEVAQLEAVRQLATEGPWRLVPTLLAAHVVPDQWAHDRAGYVALVTDTIIPEVARRGLAEMVDVYCDRGAFTFDEAVAILEAGARHGLGLRAHAEQLSATGIAGAAARLGARSADHLEHLSEADIAAMAAAGTVGVLLPSASVFLGDPARPPARAMIEAGVRVALGTDCNPGTSPTTHPWLVGTLACSWYGLSPHEALRGLTTHAARALGCERDCGTLVVGAHADLCVTSAADWRRLLYDLGESPVAETWIAGARVA